MYKTLLLAAVLSLGSISAFANVANGGDRYLPSQNTNASEYHAQQRPHTFAADSSGNIVYSDSTNQLFPGGA
jgi:hypothetical protein